MKIYINAVYGSNGFYIEAKCENGIVVPFKSLSAWNKKAKDTVRQHFTEVYNYKDIKFVA